MFGKGIYFADLVSKSANYCNSSLAEPEALLVLSEVALGESIEMTESEFIEKLPPGKHSVKGHSNCQNWIKLSSFCRMWKDRSGKVDWLPRHSARNRKCPSTSSSDPFTKESWICAVLHQNGHGSTQIARRLEEKWTSLQRVHRVRSKTGLDSLSCSGEIWVSQMSSQTRLYSEITFCWLLSYICYIFIVACFYCPELKFPNTDEHLVFLLD